MLKESLKQREQRKGYMTTWTEEHITHLKEEIEIIKTRLQPHDTGHLHDYIANMERRIEELNDNEE
jgi:hypothetical protein|tara:strand:+ start:531 stop:728 length:198 start_codon:yes stop_codon:yes gene_type:complete